MVMAERKTERKERTSAKRSPKTTDTNQVRCGRRLGICRNIGFLIFVFFFAFPCCHSSQQAQTLSSFLSPHFFSFMLVHPCFFYWNTFLTVVVSRHDQLDYPPYQCCPVRSWMAVRATILYFCKQGTASAPLFL